MRALKNYILLAAVAATVFACKKEHLQQETVTTNAPVFYFNGTVNGTPVSIQAGTNNYYMYSSYSTDSNSLLNFTGNIKPSTCTGCENSIQITLNDYKVESNATAA